MEQAASIMLCIFCMVLGKVLAVALHELGHVLAYCLEGIQIRGVYLFSIAFIHLEKWKICLCRSEVTRKGGLVLADLPAIGSKDAFDTMKRKYAKALLGGVASSIATIVLLVFFLFRIQSFYIRVMMLCYCFYAGAIVYYAFRADENGMGDLCAYRWMKHKEAYPALQLYEQLLLASNSFEKIQGSAYLHEHILELLMEKAESEGKENLTARMLDYELVLYLAGVIGSVDLRLHKILAQCTDQPYTILDRPENEGGLALLSHCVIYLARTQERNRAMKLYELIISYYIHREDEVLAYYKGQMEYILGLDEEGSYSIKNKTAKTLPVDQIYQVYPVYLEIEKRIIAD